jgi:hypothetical protein
MAGAEPAEILMPQVMLASLLAYLKLNTSVQHNNSLTPSLKYGNGFRTSEIFLK